MALICRKFTEFKNVILSKQKENSAIRSLKTITQNEDQKIKQNKSFSSTNLNVLKKLGSHKCPDKSDVIWCFCAQYTGVFALNKQTTHMNDAECISCAAVGPVSGLNKS